MRIKEILKEAEPPKVDIEHQGNWTITMSREPVILRSVTGDKAQFVAKITNKKKTGVLFTGAGSTQGAARDAAMANASKMDRPDTVKKYSHIECIMNVDFIRTFVEDLNTTYFKFVHADNDQTELVMASKHFVKVFHKELLQQGFQKAAAHSTTIKCRFAISAAAMYKYKLVPNMRYIVRESDTDEYGNQSFELIPTFVSQGPWDNLLLHTPGMTVAAIADTDAAQ